MHQNIPIGKIIALVGLEKDEVLRIINECGALEHIDSSKTDNQEQIIISKCDESFARTAQLALQRGAKVRDFILLNNPDNSIVFFDFTNLESIDVNED